MTAGLKEEEYGKRIPLGRFGDPQEVAHAVLFLLESPYITGHILLVDGGLQLTMWFLIPFSPACKPLLMGLAVWHIFLARKRFSIAFIQREDMKNLISHSWNSNYCLPSRKVFVNMITIVHSISTIQSVSALWLCWKYINYMCSVNCISPHDLNVCLKTCANRGAFSTSTAASSEIYRQPSGYRR